MKDNEFDKSLNLAELERECGLSPERFKRVIRRMRLLGYIRSRKPLPEQPAQILVFPTNPKS